MVDFIYSKGESAGITGNQIIKFRYMTLARGLEVESTGLHMTRGRSCLSIVKSEFGWKGNRASILNRLQDVIASMPDTP